MMDVFVGRQPIFTCDRTVFAYELLFRSSRNNAFPDCDGDIATSQVLANTFLSKGKDTILRGKPGFINFTQNLICEEIPLAFPKDQVFIEVLENVEPEPKVLNALRALKKKGYSIVLDDFIYDEKFQAFIDICDIIKFDLLATPLNTIEPIVEQILSMGHITLLAEKVESHEEFIQAMEKGFTLFQGYFFAKPEVIVHKGLTTNQVSKLQLLTETRKSEPDIGKIRDLIKMDVSLSFKMLKLINSSYFRRPSPVNTIKDAMVVMGLENLKKFINLAVVGDINSDKPGELTRLAIIRARLCENLGSLIKTNYSADELFTVGLFSLMDAMLDIPMEDFVSQVDFSEKMTTALMGKNPKIQDIFQVIFACESMALFNASILPSHLPRIDIIANLPKFYHDALEMADTFV